MPGHERIVLHSTAEPHLSKYFQNCVKARSRYQMEIWVKLTRFRTLGRSKLISCFNTHSNNVNAYWSGSIGVWAIISRDLDVALEAPSVWQQTFNVSLQSTGLPKS